MSGHHSILLSKVGASTEPGAVQSAWAIAARQSVTPAAAADPPVRESLRSQVDDEAGRVGQGAHLGVGALTECDRGVGPRLEPT